MKKLVFAGLLVASFAAAAEMTGYVSDAKCAKDVAKAESDGHAGCASACAKKGAALVFVSGGKVYQVADQAKLQGHAGHKVTVNGSLKGDNLTIEGDVKM